MTVDHALHCKYGNLVHIRHDDVGKEWEFFSVYAFSRGAVLHKPYIYGVNQHTCGMLERIPKPFPHHKSNTTSATSATADAAAANTANARGRPTPDIDGKHGDVGVHDFYHRGRTCIFDVHVCDTSCHSNMNTDPLTVLNRHEKEKKYKYHNI
eukprot:CAMPEP_0202007978 /NCGR_PEP_ID=MMETSP0905-20130828/12308_1 /ASSEMBLY_ACC=CAM_ASM_000554 /TAXON_ID=420261 /ORGANISM="Thalassiosira antarctica, Strain CCMP982" /LENGTH=152 /DNA_ID=CAMNT_0048566023 /DNA_START=1189 /DNA_END=1648 /DNA_ORIENTATION=+